MRNEGEPLIIAVVGRHNVGKTTVGTRMVAAWTEMGLLVAALKHDGHADERQVNGWPTDKSQVDGRPTDKSQVDGRQFGQQKCKERQGEHPARLGLSEDRSAGNEAFDLPAAPVTDDWEKPGSDTERLVNAGAAMTMVVGGGQTLLRTTRDTESKDVGKLLARLQQHAEAMGPALDVILVEGYKYSDLPKVVVMGPDDREWLAREGFTSVQAVVESPLWDWEESQRLGETVNLSPLQTETSNVSFTQKHLPVYHGNNLRDLCRSLWHSHIS